jgi:uncharacterized phage protein gp47/JayE
MPWTTPTLTDVRRRNRDYIASRLMISMVPNSNTRVVADAQGGLAHLNLQYLDWLADQLMPDLSETEWLDRHAVLWLKNADGTKGRKSPTAAVGLVKFTGTEGTIMPIDTGLRVASVGSGTVYRTSADAAMGAGPTSVPVSAVDTGSAGNLDPNDSLFLVNAIAGIDATGTVVEMTGGTDQETDDELRVRVKERIQKPPMGGDADDYVAWALAFPGVTRAWCSPKEMGIGTVTVRFMMDLLRANQEGFPGIEDVARVQAWIDSQRPVTAIDTFVVAPLRCPVSFTLLDLVPNDESTLAFIEESVRDMMRERSAPAFSRDGIAQDAQTIYASWVSEAVSAAQGVDHFKLVMEDHVPPTKGHLCVLANITAPP